jgi:uncharacterized repeat protein (TIGR03843 family)
LSPEEREEPGLLSRSPEAHLADAAVELLGHLPYSSNGTYLARCTAGEDACLAVYKPTRGERPLWDFPTGTLARREVAAFRLSSLLDLDLVPPTVWREEAPMGPGSLQLFIDHDPAEHYFTLLPGHAAFFRQLAFFDMLCNNADRKSGHCLVDKEGRVWAIDHGVTFNVEPKLRTVIWDFAGDPIPAPARAAARRLAAALEGDGGEAREAFATLLQGDEVEMLATRARELARPARFPAPDSSWSFPWPLV